MTRKSRKFGVSRISRNTQRMRRNEKEQYGMERGSKIRYAEAYEVCDYGAPLTEEIKELLYAD